MNRWGYDVFLERGCTWFLSKESLKMQRPYPVGARFEAQELYLCSHCRISLLFKKKEEEIAFSLKFNKRQIN